jgi:FMN phosphatase YigB (HAD superfamily)
MSDIQFVFFDLGNVILNFSHELTCRQIAELAKVDAGVVRQILFDRELQSRYETGMISSAELHEIFSAETDSNTSLGDFLEAGSDIFDLNVDIAPLITGLSSAGTPIGILSNTCEAHWHLIQRKYRIVRDCFPINVLSYQEHSMKPDPGIYRSAIEATGLEARQIFFMDDREENVRGARAAGIDAVQFQSANRLISELLFRGIECNL